MFCLITIIIIGHNNNMHEKIVVMSYIKTQEQQQHNFITLYGKIMTKVFGNSCDYINGANQLNSSSNTTSNEAGKLQYLFIFYDQQIVTQIT